MKCSDCQESDIWAPNVKVRKGTLRCRPCDLAYICDEKISAQRGGITVEDLDEAERIEDVLAPLLAVAEKKVRVPQVCEACGFVEGPSATRVDQVFKRYGRLVCRQCRKRNRNGTESRRRGRRR